MSVPQRSEWLIAWGWVWSCCSPGSAGLRHSTLTMGFIAIVKNIDIDILDTLKKSIIQHTELLQTCISTRLRSSC